MEIIFQKQFKPSQIPEFFANLPTYLISIEAWEAYCWARKLQALEHTVKLMATQFIKPYVKKNKHDAANAEAIDRATGARACGSCYARISSSKQY